MFFTVWEIGYFEIERKAGVEWDVGVCEGCEFLVEGNKRGLVFEKVEYLE